MPTEGQDKHQVDDLINALSPLMDSEVDAVMTVWSLSSLHDAKVDTEEFFEVPSRKMVNVNLQQRTLCVKQPSALQPGNETNTSFSNMNWIAYDHESI